MSVLTKVFVVLVTVLSVMLVAAIVPFVANTQNYKIQRDDARAAQATAEQTAQLRQSELTGRQNEMSEIIRSLTQQNNHVVGQLNEVLQKLASKQADLRGAEAQTVKLEADLSRLASATEQYSRITEDLQAELSERREQLIDYQTKMIELADRNSDLDSQLDSLSRQLRFIREDKVRLREQAEKLEQQLAQLPPEWQAKLVAQEAPQVAHMPETPIKGHVMTVKEFDGEYFVQVNVGTNDGVQENMKFLVHRSSQFLATLIITAVDEGEAAGRLELLQDEVTVGDAVLTGGY